MTERRRSSVVEVDRANDGVARINDSAMRKLSVDHPDIVQSFEEAKAATASEHDLSIRDAIKLYPKAVAFSIIFSTAVVMEGYGKLHRWHVSTVNSNTSRSESHGIFFRPQHFPQFLWH